jgi:hypothetical protein
MRRGLASRNSGIESALSSLVIPGFLGPADLFQLAQKTSQDANDWPCGCPETRSHRRMVVLLRADRAWPTVVGVGRELHVVDLRTATIRC